MVLLPWGRLVELDLGMVRGWPRREDARGLLEGSVVDVSVVWRDEAGWVGLDVVEEGVSHGLAGEIGVVWQRVDGRGLGPLRALVEELLRQLVGLERYGVVLDRRGWDVFGLARVEDGACWGLDAPGTDVQRLAEPDEGGRGQAVGLEAREELAGVCGDLRCLWLEVVSVEVLHGAEDGAVVVAEVVVFLGKVVGCGQTGLVREGVGREEHDVGELRGQAYLADALDDLVQARCEGRRAWRGWGLGSLAVVVGIWLELCRLEPEARAGKLGG